MRGDQVIQSNLFSYVDLESRIPEKHQIRRIKKVVDKALSVLSNDFDEMYSHEGRPSIPPEQLLRALLLQIFFSIRSERQLMERINYDLLFRWFVGISMDAEVWNHSTFSKNRDRLLKNGIDELFFDAVKKQAKAKQLMSREHFSVDGTLLDACASMKSFRPKDDAVSDGENFHNEKRTNDTHQSTTDGDSRLIRKGKGKEAKLSHMGHLLTENRNGFIVDTEVTEAGTSQEWHAGISLLARLPECARRTVGADKGYDTCEFVEGCRELKITPHVAQKAKNSCIDLRTTGTWGYQISQCKRKRIEQCFGWLKDVGLMRKLRHRSRVKVSWIFRFTSAAYNIVRLQKLLMEK
jgi:transposase